MPIEQIAFSFLRSMSVNGLFSSTVPSSSYETSFRPRLITSGLLVIRPLRLRLRCFLNHNLVYNRPAGADSLREAIAEMQSVPVEAVQIVNGASEALVALMWLTAEPGANVIIPLPGFTTFSALPESLGLETRFYRYG